MGNTRSLQTDGEPEDPWWPNDRNVNCDLKDKKLASQNPDRLNSDDEGARLKELSEEHKEKLNEFKLELARKHEKRRQIMAEKRKEIDDLREEVVKLRKENQQLREESVMGKCSFQEDTTEIDRLRQENENLKSISEEKSKLLETSETIIENNRELRINIAKMQRELQGLNKKVLAFEMERKDYEAHVVALKDVIAVSKHMLQIRETQLKELKQKVESIEESLAEREMNVLSQDLRTEYERQLQNIRNLRTLYEERQRVERREKEGLISQLDDIKRELQTEKNKVSELEERNNTLEEDNSKKYDEIKTLESNLGLSKAESRQYQAELAVINQLFSEILLGFNSSQDINLDQLQKHLEEHHELLQNIFINEISSEVSYALPKVLLDLLNQVNTKACNPEVEQESRCDGKLDTIKEESESHSSSIHQINSTEEIVENLPKVWRVLIELLSHQKAPINNLTDDEEDENPCYKTVQTPKGPSLVLSVSQTFIRLKDLILEKKSLEKETNHLKQLNCHLENRLQDQEKRLELVHAELSKTWLVVGKLQKQHQMLHTQEKILRYELAQKRKLLTELKEELEYSREKWAQAREKNSSTEQQWQQLRTEFASRRTTIISDDLNNSVESGYSDDRECSSDEEPGYETGVSKRVQKISKNDHIDVTEIEGNPEASNDSPTLNLIPMELKESETCQTNENRDLLNTDNTEQVIHSTLEQVKTDLEQNDKSTEKTVDDIETENAAESQTSSLDERDQPSTSQDEPKKSLEEVLKQRDERLKLLEAQAEQLVLKVLKTANRSIVISNKLDNLHEAYGQSSDESDSSCGGNEEDADLVQEETSDDIVMDDHTEVPSTDINVESMYNYEENNQE